MVYSALLPRNRAKNELRTAKSCVEVMNWKQRSPDLHGPEPLKPSQPIRTVQDTMAEVAVRILC